MARAELMKSSLAKEKSFKVEVEPGASDSNWLCRAEAEMVINLEVIDRLRPSLEAIARHGNGEYDGWECAAEP